MSQHLRGSSVGAALSPATLGPDERWRLLQLLEAATPAGAHLPPATGATVDATARFVEDGLPTLYDGWRLLLGTLDLASVPLEGARLSELPLARRKEALGRLASAEATAWLVRAACAPLQIVRAQAGELEAALSIPGPQLLPLAREPRADEPRRLDLRHADADEVVEADVVVVGTGAGGAPVAARLAQRGHAVVLLEEGGDFTRADFGGRPLDRQRRLYRDGGLTFALGSSLIPIPIGRTVGGTTTINSGTCYRTPAEVQRRWAVEHGLRALGPGSLDAHFERVEDVLGVAPSGPEILGEIARIVARGADALGYRHGPLARNAPGCDAQATCAFGCPTDAKRSTNVSYVPLALRHGAMLYHHARVVRILGTRGRATGVEAVATGTANGSARRLVVRARAVVLACGTLHTPTLLLGEGLANASGQVGKNLTIHPAGYAFARFPEPVRGWAGVPQGYAIEELEELGIRFEGAFPPPALAAAALGSIGDAWTRDVESMDELAIFGFMIRDQSRGRVTRGVDGRPNVRYSLCDADVRTVLHAQATLARVFLAAGATDVRPGLSTGECFRSEAEVERFEREAPGRIRAHHLALSAYHPLGTCRMGGDPARSVISGEHEAHDVEGLFVVDGSAVPGPLGVNPQITIMALSERATEFVERRIEARRPRPAAWQPRAGLAFDETMAGECERVADGGRVRASFTVRASGPVSPGALLSSRAALELEGAIDVFGLATGRPCRGTLTMRPMARRGNLLYELAFDDDRGVACTLRGEKHAPLFSPAGMTRLFTEVRRDGEPYARGLLHFDLRDLPSWLRTFRRTSGAETVEGGTASRATAS